MLLLYKLFNIKKYSVKELKFFTSIDCMHTNTRKYKKVFEQSQTAYIYVEIPLFNKLMNDSDWVAKVRIVFFELQRNSRKHLATINQDYPISKEESLVLIREGWGSANRDFWKLGDYECTVYINDDLVMSEVFHIEDAASNSIDKNPYFEFESFQLYQGPNEGVSLTERIYASQFVGSETAYIWFELNLKNKIQEPWYGEFFFNIYEIKSGMQKGGSQELIFVRKDSKIIEVLSGWGAKTKDTWFANTYRIEIVFMDEIIHTCFFEIT